MLQLDEKEYYGNNDNCYTREEICELLNISNSYLNTLTSKQIIPFIKVGKHIKFPKIWINEWNKIRAILVDPDKAISNIQNK